MTTEAKTRGGFHVTRWTLLVHTDPAKAREEIEAALAQARGIVTEAARAAGCSRQSLHNYMQALDISGARTDRSSVNTPPPPATLTDKCACGAPAYRKKGGPCKKCYNRALARRHRGWPGTLEEVSASPRQNTSDTKVPWSPLPREEAAAMLRQALTAAGSKSALAKQLGCSRACICYWHSKLGLGEEAP